MQFTNCVGNQDIVISFWYNNPVIAEIRFVSISISIDKESQGASESFQKTAQSSYRLVITTFGTLSVSISVRTINFVHDLLMLQSTSFQCWPPMAKNRLCDCCR